MPSDIARCDSLCSSFVQASAKKLAWLAMFSLFLARSAGASLIMDFHTWPVGQEPVPGVNPPDGLDDIWQQLYNAWGLDPNGDADNDGCSNWFECQAGTNPFVAGDCLRIGNTIITAGQVLIHFDAKAGKKYSIVSDDAPNGAFATTEALLSPESGTSFIPAADINNKILKVAKAPGSRKFYRLRTEDVDSNNDGVSDWVARQLGLDPAAPAVDLDGNGKSDLLDMLESQMTQPDEISVIATIPFASEDGPTSGKFTIQRTRSMFDAQVNLGFSGTASGSTDYSKFPSVSQVDFSPGESSADIYINPLADAVLEGGESVILTLTNPQSVTCATPPVLGNDSAVVIIQNNTSAAGTGLLARYYDSAAAVYDSAGNFGGNATYTYTRSGSAPNYTGTTVVTPARAVDIADLQAGNQVRLSFTSGNLNNATYNHQTYTVTSRTATTFTVSMPPGADLPGNSTNALAFFRILSYPHPPVIERVDETVNNTWFGGTPNGVAVAVGTNSTANPVDNYSSVWEGHLHPSSTANYQFRLDADDRARVLLDLNRNGVFDLPEEQIVEHGWDGPATVGAFKVSAAHALSVPANASQRYKIRVEHVETTGEARCVLQWRQGTGNYATIPQANVFTHTQAMSSNYSYTRSGSSPNFTGSVVITLNNHGLQNGDTAEVAFSSGNLFLPGNGNYHGAYSVSGATTNTFVITLPPGPGLPASGSGAGFVLNRPSSTTTGWFNQVYTNTTFTAPPGRVGVDNTGSNTSNGGLYGSGTPDVASINPDTFSAVWTGQVQPQFSEEYTFYVLADDSFRLWINGQEMSMRQLASANVGVGTYTYVSATGETLVNYANSIIDLNSFGVGDIARVDPTGGTITSFPTTDLPVTAATANTFTVFFPPGYGDQTTGAAISADALNRVIKPWSASTNERYCRIPLVAGQRYDIRLEYYENTGSSRCQLFWNSLSQPKQIIPANRLYPDHLPSAPPAHISDTEVVALVGGPLSIPVSASNGAAISFSGLPAWLTYNNGVLTGTPPSNAEGNHQILLTLTNASGSSQSLINLTVINTGGAITREVWTGVAGDTMASFPSGPPTSTGTLSSLQAPADFADDYATRLRGYLTAPETGNYYFWLAANNAAELYISNDAEPVNAFHRASVTGGSAVPLDWASAAKSPWLALEQGKRYYIEVRHKAGTGLGDNLAIGWSKPGESVDTPSEVVPGYALSPWSEPVAPPDGGTVYAAILRPQGGAVTNASGSSFLRLNEAETEAIISVNYTGLTSAFFGMHVHDDNIPGGGTNNIIADLEEPGDVQLLPDGTYKWVIKPTAGYSVPQLVQHIKNGEVYFNVHSVNYPGGEIKGYYSQLDGSPVFVPPPAPPSWTDDSDTDDGAVRFLTQATFGANAEDVQALKAITPAGGKSRYELWIEDQFTKPVTYSLPEVLRTRRADAQGGSAYLRDLFFNSWWWNSVAGADQLRQRVAFALSQIHVVSGEGPLLNRGDGLAFFYDCLAENAFANFRDILLTTTLTPTMGRYLDMLRNDKPDLAVGRIPNENYAREIKQLFSIGLFRMWPDGTLILNSKFEPVDTYSQREIVGLSHVFTGWDYGYDGGFLTGFNAPNAAPGAWTRLMREVPARHFTGQKRILNNEVLPGLDKVGSQPLDPYAAHNSMYFNHPAYQALPQQELNAAHDQLFYHPNTGPFICRQLIQRLVTSHPSRGYVYRVVQKFNDNGAGVRGDMKAVIKAILLDYEARSPAMLANASFGKQREPLLRLTAPGRAFRRAAFSATYQQSGTRTITISGTSPAHGLANGNNVLLEFSGGAPDPNTGVYSVSNVTANGFTIQATGWVNSTYNIPANSTVCTVNLNNHWLQIGNQFFIDFTSGGADGTSIDGQVYTVATNPNPLNGGNNGNTFTFNVPTTSTSTRSGNCMIPRFTPGSYTVAASGLPAPNDRRVTMRTNEDHHLNPGDLVQLNITAGNPLPADVVATVETVPNARTWTFLIASTVSGYQANQGNNGVYQFPLLSQPLHRSGTVNSRPSTFQMGNTDANLEQSPLNAETVFNFFLPDYKFPGPLAALNLTTPEFQLTSETTTIRQANFIFGGVFNPSTTNGFSSFTSGNNALVMDFSPYMGDSPAAMGIGAAAPVNNRPWTHNQNIATFIDNLSLLLSAGQLSTQTKTIIRDLVSLPIQSIATGNPCTVTTVRPHGYKTGDTIFLKGVTGGTFSPSAAFGNSNDGYAITVTGASTFTVTGVNCTAAPNASQVANAHVSQILYNQGSNTPDAAHRRDRIRSVIHLILTSPDYTIQR